MDLDTEGIEVVEVAVDSAGRVSQYVAICFESVVMLLPVGKNTRTVSSKILRASTCQFFAYIFPAAKSAISSSSPPQTCLM
jgi:hypothetical protein